MTRYFVRYSAVALLTAIALVPAPAFAVCFSGAAPPFITFPCPPGVTDRSVFFPGSTVPAFVLPPNGTPTTTTPTTTPPTTTTPTTTTPTTTTSSSSSSSTSIFDRFNVNSQFQANTTLNPDSPFNPGMQRGPDGILRPGTVFNDELLDGIAGELRRLEEAWRKATDPKEKERIQAEIDEMRADLDIGTLQDVLDGLRWWNMTEEEFFRGMFANFAAEKAKDDLKRLEDAWRKAVDPQERNKVQAEIDSMRAGLGIPTLPDVLEALGLLDSINAGVPVFPF